MLKPEQNKQLPKEKESTTRLRGIMKEHYRRLETDEEYRKRSEEADEFVEKFFLDLVDDVED